MTLLERIAPDEVYNLAAQSHVRVSFDEPEFTGDVTGLGATRLLEAIRCPRSHVATTRPSTSEMFGGHPAAAERGDRRSTPGRPTALPSSTPTG